MPRLWAFSFFVAIGLILAVGLALLFDFIPILASNTILGLPWSRVLAVWIAAPVADLTCKRIFGQNPFGKRQ